jgi:hypothetical protein
MAVCTLSWCHDAQMVRIEGWRKHALVLGVIDPPEPSRYSKHLYVMDPGARMALKADCEKIAFARVLDSATRVIGGTPEALRWLGTPVQALDYATPISLLSSPEGTRSVLEVLERLEHGVY